MARYRERVKPDLPTYLSYMDNSGVTWTTDYADYSPYKKWCSDTVTPQFNRKINEGHIINNACVIGERTRVIDTHSESFYKHDSENWFQTWGDGLIGALLSSPRDWVGSPRNPNAPPDPGSVHRNVKVKALSRIDSTPYAFGEDIGELRETIRFLKRPTESLHNLSKSYRRAVKQRLRNGKMDLAEAVASVHLSFRFALTPLVRSMFDLAGALEEGPFSRPVRRHARAEDIFDYESLWDFHQSNKRYFLEGSETVHDVYKAQILYQVTNPAQGLQAHLGLRGKDIPETVWQLLPYSFMVDRIYDVSSAVSAVVNLADPAIEILAASTTSKRTDIRTLQYVDAEKSGWTGTVNSTPRVDTFFRYTRTPWTPSLSDVAPALQAHGLVSDATRIADLLALITANFRYKI